MGGRAGTRAQAVALVVAVSCALAGNAGSASAAVDDCVAPPTDGYGLAGPHATRVLTFQNPLLPTLQVRVYAPAGGDGPWPVLFFSHAFGADDPDRSYRPFIDRLVSRGAIVVFSPYSTGHAVAARDDAYDQLWAGFEEAVRRHRDTLGMDLGRVGFLGHSFGGGATPEMFRRGVMERGWGDRGRFMDILAPYRVFHITPEQMAAFPADTKVVVQVYDEDDTNDHRFAIEQIWKRLTSIPERNRDYVLVRSAASGGCSLPSDHGVPMTGGGRYGKLDAYDAWAVWRHAAALMGCAFDGDAEGCAIVLGHGSEQQTRMGRWRADGSPLPRLESMADPVPTNCGPGETCTFRYDGSPIHELLPASLQPPALGGSTAP